jgi:penicillin amidase
MKILLRSLLGLGAVLVLLIFLAIGVVWLSLPQLDGPVTLSGLDQSVRISRDKAGVPTITAPDRQSLAMALGFIHAQERFFQMDLLRRAGAGELAQLVGAAATKIDEPRRIHRMRARLNVALQRASADDRALFDAYAMGVNAGLSALKTAPFEYWILRKKPEPWRAEDALLVNAAMYFDLERSDGWDEQRLALAREALGPQMADFLYRRGGPLDAPIDASVLPDVPMPSELALPDKQGARDQADLPMPGSNNWAVDGSLSQRGAAILANDMHLAIREPNIWYRARLIVQKPGQASPDLDLIGVTLPGVMGVIVGSNTHVAWGFTNSLIDTGDMVILDPVDGNAMRYQTPEGPKDIQIRTERLCPGDCPVLTVEETIWGPVVATDNQGRKLVYRWVAHDMDAGAITAFLRLEKARDIHEAMDAVHGAPIPDQNFVVADSSGHIAWTIAGRVPHRFGHDGSVPVSWADGQSGWNGYLNPDDIPAIIDPADHRLWTANARVVGGDALALLGDGGYAGGARAAQIRDDLFAKNTFDEKDLLAIQLDDRTPVMTYWRDQLSGVLTKRSNDSLAPKLTAELAKWNGHAAIDSIGYRIIRTYRQEVISRVYGAFTAQAAAREATHKNQWLPRQAENALRPLIDQQPPGLVPPGYKSWADVFDSAVQSVEVDINKLADGKLERYSWGARNMTAVHHPLVLAIPLLSSLLDPPNEPVPGDSESPRVGAPGFGASERLVVAPGHEDTGIFHMATGQSGHPMSPYYNMGHENWVRGLPSPLLPGAAQWTMTLQPGVLQPGLLPPGRQ